jgi:hypothetical protein
MQYAYRNGSSDEHRGLGFDNKPIDDTVELGKNIDDEVDWIAPLL